MAMTSAALWLNEFFSGYDNAILSLMHSLANSLGAVLTPLMKVITFLGEKGIIFFLLALIFMCFSSERDTGVCVFGAVCCGALITNFILKDWIARPRPFETDAACFAVSVLFLWGGVEGFPQQPGGRDLQNVGKGDQFQIGYITLAGFDA